MTCSQIFQLTLTYWPKEGVGYYAFLLLLSLFSVPSVAMFFVLAAVTVSVLILVAIYVRETKECRM